VTYVTTIAPVIRGETLNSLFLECHTVVSNQNSLMGHLQGRHMPSTRLGGTFRGPEG
jgi:hypothetical protein